MTARPFGRRRLLAPVVMEAAPNEAGPAALKSLLDGLGSPVRFRRLREATQTDADGGSIDLLAVLARNHGFEAERIVVPRDWIAFPEAGLLPAVAMVQRPDRGGHHVALWAHQGPWVQVMDPTVGRRWSRRDELLEELHVGEVDVPVARVLELLEPAAEGGLFGARLSRLGCAEVATGWLEAARADRTGAALAELDAALRMLEALVRARALTKGREVAAALGRLEGRRRGGAPDETLPSAYWAMTPEEGGLLKVRGVALVRVGVPTAMSAEMQAEAQRAQKEERANSARELWRLLKADGLVLPGVFVAALLLARVFVLLEGLLLRGLFGLQQELALAGQRLAAIAALVLFMLFLFFIELPIIAAGLRFGRRLEARARMALLRKLPRIADRYFSSRTGGDTAERLHSLHLLKQAPELIAEVLTLTFRLTFCTLGVIWLDLASAPLALATSLVSVAVPVLGAPLLARWGLRARSYSGALARFYFDAMMGLIPIRSHGAERSVRREHEGLLGQWAGAGLAVQRRAVVVEGVEMLVGFGLAGLLVATHVARSGPSGAVTVLLVFWTLNLPVFGQDVVAIARQLTQHHNVLVRLLEPLSLAENPDEAEPAEPVAALLPERRAPRRRPAVPQEEALDDAESPRGVSVTLRGVRVKRLGRVVLDGVDVAVGPGSHVAVLGRSGAGKSTLMSVLLGFHTSVEGRVEVDEKPLVNEHLARIRRLTAWVDPQVHLWNRSLLDNLCYGVPPHLGVRLESVLEETGMRALLQKLPSGLQTVLGEGGTFLSGGEGQLVRLGRGLQRSRARLVILDEPFRGINRERRAELLALARRVWRHATLFYVCHEASEAARFDRVLVVEEGRLVEDGNPQELLAKAGSRLQRVQRAEDAVRALLEDPGWRRLHLDRGRVVAAAEGSEEAKR